MSKKNIFKMYEQAVQTPEAHTSMLRLVYADIFGRQAYSLREDFCGTFLISKFWVKQGHKYKATCIDLDLATLDYGKKTHLKNFSDLERSRLKILNQDVRKKTSSHDIVAACNFSFYIFKTKSDLLNYFKSVYASLKNQGVFFLEMSGGPGMIEKTREQQTIRTSPSKKFTYIWEQKKFDPITHFSEYAIHFKLQNGKKIMNAFTYDWRLWTLPEVLETMTEAGFQSTHVYWEKRNNGKPTGTYARSKTGDNQYAWIAYAVGAKSV